MMYFMKDEKPLEFEDPHFDEEENKIVLPERNCERSLTIGFVNPYQQLKSKKKIR